MIRNINPLMHRNLAKDFDFKTKREHKKINELCIYESVGEWSQSHVIAISKIDVKEKHSLTELC